MVGYDANLFNSCDPFQSLKLFFLVNQRQNYEFPNVWVSEWFIRAELRHASVAINRKILGGANLGTLIRQSVYL